MLKFIARVIDVNDPERSGRVKIRVYGAHDDIQSLPDSDLPWARCVFPVTNPVYGGVAGPTTGLVANSTVIGVWMDDDMQVPIVEGTLGRSGIDGQSYEYRSETNSIVDVNSGRTLLAANTARPTSDFPAANVGEDTNVVSGASTTRREKTKLKSALQKTIADIKYRGQQVQSLIAEVNGVRNDVESIIGEVQQTVSAFNDLKRLISANPLEQVNSIVQGYVDQFESIGSGFENSIDLLTSGNITGAISDADNAINRVSSAVTLAGEVISDPIAALSPLNPLPGAQQIVSQLESATGIIFDTSNHLLGSVGARTSKKKIKSVQDALNRISGHRYVMSNSMTKIEASLSRLRTKVKKKSENG